MLPIFFPSGQAGPLSLGDCQASTQPLKTHLHTVSPDAPDRPFAPCSQVIQLGSIPIYLWETQKWLPYQELVDWNSFALVLHSSQLDSLEERVKEAQARYGEYQAALHRVQHMFTYRYAARYIAQYMQRCARGGPC